MKNQTLTNEIKTTISNIVGARVTVSQGRGSMKGYVTFKSNSKSAENVYDSWGWDEMQAINKALGNDSKTPKIMCSLSQCSYFMG